MFHAWKQRTIFTNRIVFLSRGTAAEELFTTLTEDVLGSRVHGDDRALGIVVDHALQHRLFQNPVVLLTQPQRLLRPLPLRDVHVDAKDAADLTTILNRADDVVVRPCLTPYVRFHFPFHSFASKGSPVVVEPQFDECIRREHSLRGVCR